jgi:hypothetical protein
MHITGKTFNLITFKFANSFTLFQIYDAAIVIRMIVAGGNWQPDMISLVGEGKKCVLNDAAQNQ